MSVIISPSILSISKEHVESVIKELENSNAKWLHIDVMDGKFVPNFAYDFHDVIDIRKMTNMFLDVHLMITDLLENLPLFIKAKPDLISFHIEAIKDEDELNECLNLLEINNIKKGLVISPNTNQNSVLKFLDRLDLILVMSVEPGRGGQSFIDSSLIKIKTLKEYIVNNHLNTLIEVDGGINETTSKLVKEAGADILVSGSYIVKSKNISEAVDSLLK